MSHKINVKAFFFNAKTDYLPYYKNFTLLLAEGAVAKDILVAIQAQNENFSYPELNLIFKINDLIVEEDTPLNNIVDKLGTTLKIDPANSYRSNNGLIINNDDFMQSYELLAPYATDADKQYYKTLYALHYASESENFNRNYIGDAILVLAHKMISEGSEHKTEILNAITSADSGLLDCEYENNLFNAQDHTASITALKEMVKNDDNDSDARSLLERIKARFGSQEETIVSTSLSSTTQKTNHTKLDNIMDKTVAYYAGNTDNTAMYQLLEESDIATVNFSRAHKLAGVSIVEDDPTLAFKKAGVTLLDAFDAGAEIVIIEDNATYDMMKNHFSDIERVIGRKMIGLELISAEDFVEQLNSVTV
ncbi:MAG TPA: hypothetical protein ENK90_02910 [Epsilonproteobacteria bacterium]|nr:hypothetical protein [Campylobacterota bacterium]